MLESVDAIIVGIVALAVTVGLIGYRRLGQTRGGGVESLKPSPPPPPPIAPIVHAATVVVAESAQEDRDEVAAAVERELSPAELARSRRDTR